MVRWLVLSLLALPVCLAVVQLLSLCLAPFTVIGPPEPVLAMVGEDAELPCHLSPEMSAENMKLKWERLSPRQVVLTYAHGQEDTPAAEYGGRTSILREDITAGKAALQIHDVRASDSGNYLCYFQDGVFFENAKVELKVADQLLGALDFVLTRSSGKVTLSEVLPHESAGVRVSGLHFTFSGHNPALGFCLVVPWGAQQEMEALGSDPHIEMKGYEAGGIRLECTSAGWYPQPQIQWRDARGQSLSAEVATEAADPQGLYSASASVILEAGSGEGVSCVIRNPLLGQERSAMASIPGPFFRKPQPWMVALGVTLLALLGLLVLMGSFLWRQQKEIQALSKEKERERAEKEEAKWEKRAAQREKEAAELDKEAAQAENEALKAENEALKAELRRQQSHKEGLRYELEWTKTRYRPREERSQAYAVWKMAFFQPADVFLDPDTAHPGLCVSEDKRRLKWTGTWQNLPKHPERFYGNLCVLGCESFSSGNRFWEVEVGDRKNWHVGVCRENVQRKRVQMTPENGFWVMTRYHGDNYRALTDPLTPLALVSPPERVGVFLDYDLDKVSFYNAIDGSHIFTFPPTYFSGPLRPVFGIWTTEPTPLTIRSAQK